MGKLLLEKVIRQRTKLRHWTFDTAVGHNRPVSWSPMSPARFLQDAPNTICIAPCGDEGRRHITEKPPPQPSPPLQLLVRSRHARQRFAVISVRQISICRLSWRHIACMTTMVSSCRQRVAATVATQRQSPDRHLRVFPQNSSYFLVRVHSCYRRRQSLRIRLPPLTAESSPESRQWTTGFSGLWPLQISVRVECTDSVEVQLMHANYNQAFCDAEQDIAPVPL
jgi:hypothetical protein